MKKSIGIMPVAMGAALLLGVGMTVMAVARSLGLS